MEFRRTLLIVAMAVVGYFLLINWQKDIANAPQPTAPTAQTSSTAASGDLPAAPSAVANSNGDLPVAPQKTTPATTPAAVATATSVSVISVKTDVLDVQIDLLGGDVVHVALPAYTESVDSAKPFVLLDRSAARTFVAQSGLVGTQGPDRLIPGRPHYQTAASSFALKDGEKSLQVVLTLPAQDGVQIRKIYEFERGNYLIHVRYEIANQGSVPWSGNMFGQLKRDNSKDPSASNRGFGMSTFLGAAWWTPEKSYNKQSFKQLAENQKKLTGKDQKPIELKATGGWIASVQHYFVAAWIPDAKATNNFFGAVNADGDNLLGYTSPEITVAPGQAKVVGASLYAGPKVQEKLKHISDGLELTVDYGWLWFIAQFLFWLLVKIHGVVGNWGWAIVILTVLVKAAFFQLSATSYKSMAHMRRVTPEIQRLREQYSNDRAKMSQAMMELYKKERINPLGGCLPILVQMPVFIALYWTLMESVELRHAGWILWIRDLSAMDPYFILPLIMGGSMLVQTLLNPAPADPMQAKVMKLMPLVFTFMFLWFPAGLVLYWVVNNILSIAQQALITRQIERAEGKRA